MHLKIPTLAVSATSSGENLPSCHQRGVLFKGLPETRLVHHNSEETSFKKNRQVNVSQKRYTHHHPHHTAVGRQHSSFTFGETGPVWTSRLASWVSWWGPQLRGSQLWGGGDGGRKDIWAPACQGASHFQFIPLIGLCLLIKCRCEAGGSGGCLGWAR